MSANSFNLVDLIRGYLTDDSTTKLSSILGESRDRIRSGVGAAIPGILSGLDGSTSTFDGARRVITAVEEADDTMLDQPGKMFGTASAAESGLGTLRSIMGVGGFSDLSNNIGRFSGLPAKSVASLLGFVAPLVFGAIRRYMLSKGMAFTDIARLLSSQRANIAAAMPGVMTGRGPAPVEPMRDVTEDAYTSPRAASRGTTTERYVETRSSSWILPLALLAGALGLIWYMASRPTVHAGREATTSATLETLKTKYDSVFREARAQGVNITSATMENGRLVLRGTAPSLEAANKVWDEIRRVNPAFDEIVAEFPIVSTAMPSTTANTAPEEIGNTASGSDNGVGAAGSDNGMYVVKRGDTLRSISKQFYGNTKDYTRILEANRNQITDKDVIRVGQELMVPKG